MVLLVRWLVVEPTSPQKKWERGNGLGGQEVHKDCTVSAQRNGLAFSNRPGAEGGAPLSTTTKRRV